MGTRALYCLRAETVPHMHHPLAILTMAIYLLWLHSRCLHSSWQPHMRFHLAQLDVPAVEPTSWRGSEAGWRAELAHIQRQVLRHPRPSAYACALHVHVHVH